MISGDGLHSASSSTRSTHGMAKTTDERGQIHLAKDIIERFGKQYRIVELPFHVALLSVNEDPPNGLRAAVGEAFTETEADELQPDARRAIAREIQQEAEERSQTGGE